MAITTGSVKVETADGAMPCHVAAPATGGPYPAIIVVMEAFGLNGQIEAVAERIAREGSVTLAPDLYHRSGSPVIAYDDVPTAIAMMRKLEDATVMADVAAAIAHLQARRDVKPDRIGITGFCMGGTVTFKTAAHHATNIKAAVSFYGGGSLATDDRLALVAAPLLALWGERDDFIPLDHVKRIEETMRRLGKTYESRVYAGAGHGFFCDDRASYHPESARDAWTRMMGWFARYLASN